MAGRNSLVLVAPCRIRGRIGIGRVKNKVREKAEGRIKVERE